MGRWLSRKARVERPFSIQGSQGFRGFGFHSPQISFSFLFFFFKPNKVTIAPPMKT